MKKIIERYLNQTAINEIKYIEKTCTYPDSKILNLIGKHSTGWKINKNYKKIKVTIEIKEA